MGQLRAHLSTGSGYGVATQCVRVAECDGGSKMSGDCNDVANCHWRHDACEECNSHLYLSMIFNKIYGLKIWTLCPIFRNFTFILREKQTLVETQLQY